MSAPRRIGCRLIAALAFSVACRATDLRASGLGPHGRIATNGGACTACHLSPIPRSLDIGALRTVEVPRGGKARLADPMARFCWACHRAGSPSGGPPLGGRALDAPGHGVIPGKATTPDSWAVGRPVIDPYTRSGIHKSGMGYVGCATCHDVHDGGAPLFLRETGAAKEDTELCAACHPGRENAGLTGRRNIVVADRSPYSTHPAMRAGVAPGSRDVVPRCLDCHDVHRATPPGGKPVPGLLRVAPGETTSDLCRRCHAFPAPGGREAHPMEAPAAGRISRDSFTSPRGLPPEWLEDQHFDRGAVQIATGEAPRCTSCHDLHGGLPMTSLLYGPDAGSRDGGDWCFSCHQRPALLALGHAGADPGGGCARCHGAPRDGSPARWEAHRGFRTVRPAAASGAAAGGSEPTVPAVDAAAVRVLVESLQDRNPAVRDQAADVLSRLRPELDPAALLPAAGDARAEVRTRTARVIGALGDRRGGDILLRLVADPEPQVRAAAAHAFTRIGDPRAAGALLPLLADPSLEARRAAVDAFATLRDPRAIPGLVALLQDPDWDLGAKARTVLASLDDARALDALLAAPFHPAALMDVLDGMSDPAAFDDIVPLLGHNYRHVRAAAARALGRYPRPGVVEALAGVLRDAVGPDAAASLVRLGDPRAASLLAGVLNDPDANPAIKRAMAKILADIATRPVVTPLVDALSDRDAGVREAANAALGRLTCRNFGVDQARWREWWGAQSPSFPLGRCQ